MLWFIASVASGALQLRHVSSLHAVIIEQLLSCDSAGKINCHLSSMMGWSPITCSLCLSYIFYKERKLLPKIGWRPPKFCSKRNCQWRQGRPCDGQTVELIIAAVLAALVPGPCFAPQLGNPGRSFSPRIVITIIKTVFKTKHHGAEQQQGNTS